MDFAVSPVKELAGGSASGAHRGTELPKKCHRRKQQKCNLGVTLRRSCWKRRGHALEKRRMSSFRRRRKMRP